MTILVINGPNLNLLGTREPDRYGSRTLDQVNEGLAVVAAELGVSLAFFQANGEGALVDRIHAARGNVDGIVINAGAYTHTSVALRDALVGVAIPFVEVHLSNVHAREAFRQRSFLSDVAVGVVLGFGEDSYALGLRGLVRRLRQR